MTEIRRMAMDLKIGARVSTKLPAIGWVKAIIDSPLDLTLDGRKTQGFLFRIYKGKYEGGTYWSSTVNVLSGLLGPAGNVEFIPIMTQSQITESRVNKKPPNAFILSCLAHGAKILGIDEETNTAIIIKLVENDTGSGKNVSE